MRKQLLLQLVCLVFIASRVKGQETIVSGTMDFTQSVFKVLGESAGLMRMVAGAFIPSAMYGGPFGSMLDSMGVKGDATIASLGSAVAQSTGSFLNLVAPGIRSLVSSVTGMLNHDEDEGGRGGRGGRWSGGGGGGGGRGGGGWGRGRGGGGRW